MQNRTGEAAFRTKAGQEAQRLNAQEAANKSNSDAARATIMQGNAAARASGNQAAVQPVGPAYQPQKHTAQSIMAEDAKNGKLSPQQGANADKGIMARGEALKANGQANKTAGQRRVEELRTNRDKAKQPQGKPNLKKTG